MNIINVLGIGHLLKMKKAHSLALKYIRGFMVTECISTFFNTGIFNDMLHDRSLDLDSYAISKNLDKKILKVIFDYLYAVRLLDKDNSRYRFSREGSFIFKYTKGPFDFVNAYSPIFQNLESLLKKEKKYGVEIKRIDSFVAKASAETEQWIPYPVIKKVIKKYNFKNILDLGCGSAEFLIKLCETNPNMRGFGIDVSPIVIECAQKEVASCEVKERIELQQCDIFNISKLPEMWFQKIDVITCMFVLHEFIKDDNTTKITNLLKEIRLHFKNAYIIVCELYKNSPKQLRRNPSLIAEHHLFHALSNQEILTYEEWKNVFEKTPFKLIEEIKFEPAGQGYFILK